jgi:hypothetical protein
VVEYVFEPPYTKLDFTLEGCEGPYSHGDLPHRSPSYSMLERYLSGERVFINPPSESVEHISRHFERCRRTTPTSTMVELFFLSGLSSTSSLDTGNSTENSE